MPALHRRLVAPLLAGVATSAVVAAIAVAGGTTSERAAAPPTPSGQPAGQLELDGKTMAILSYSTGVSNPVTIGSGSGGAGAGKASFSALSMLKYVDANSPRLMLAVATGKHFPKAVLTAQWGTGPASATATYELQDVIVESVQHSGGGGSAPSEALSLAFGAVKWSYTDASGTTTGSWDVVSNQG